MNYSTLRLNTISKQKLFVDKKTIFLVLPDTNIDISNEIYNLNFLLSNCKGIVCPNKMITIGHKKFNGKEHFYDVKKKLIQISSETNVGKKLNIYNSLMIEKAKKEQLTSSKTSDYYLYDASIWSKGIDYLLQYLSEKNVVKSLINELASLYTQIKSNNPEYSIELLILVKNQSGRLLNIITNIRTFIKMDELENYHFFDKFALIQDMQKTIIPFLTREKDKTKLIVQNLNKIRQHYQSLEITNDINKVEEPAIADSKETSEIPFLISKNSEEEQPSIPIKKNSIISNIVNSLQTSKLVADSVTKNSSEIPKVTINKEELSKALKKNKITDPDIVANVQSSINNYIASNNTKPDLNKAEELVFKAINYTLTGSDEISEEYLDHPELLFNKLTQLNTYKVPLNIPKTGDVIEPKHLIDLNYTTGQHRQKFEFENAIHENITKLFNSLENVGTEYPIKVKKIEHEIKDNNQDRYINYRATLQNVNGGKKEPYVVELNVPSPVNEKYFKLHGNSYIMSSQQFLRPITKTDKNEVRLISNYGIVRVGLANSKFNPTDINEITKYIQIKYPKLIKELNDEICKFEDGSIIFFTGENVYTSANIEVKTDSATSKLINSKTNETIKQNKFEFLFDVFLNKIHTINSADNLAKTKKALPYFWVYLGGLKMPLLIYLWSQKGLLPTLNSFGINYEIVDKEIPEVGVFFIALADGKSLKITPETLKQRFLINALLSTIKLKDPINDLNDPQEIYPYIIQNYGSRAIVLIRLLTENFTDQITKELLQFENLPTNLVDLISKPSLDQLLNKKPDSLSDLKIYRARLSEVILNLVYKQIKLSHNYYRRKIIEGDQTATVFLDPEYVINNLLTTAGVLQNTEPVSPVSEIMLSSRVIKGGKGGKKCHICQ